jgi:putative tricarboxylic transport membrane protein
MVNKDRLSSIMLLAFCAFFYYATYKIDVSDIVGIDSAFFPRMILGLIAVLALTMLGSTFVSVQASKTETKEHVEKNNELPIKKRGRIVGAIFALFLLYILGIDFIGFIFASFLFMVAMYFLILEEKRTTKKHVLAMVILLVTTVLLTFFFEQFLDVYLPRGLFDY